MGQKFRIGKQEYESVGPDELTLAEAVKVRLATGLGFNEFYVALGTDDPVALQAMVWLVRLRRGERDVTLADVDFRLGDFELIGEPELDDDDLDPTTSPGEGSVSPPPNGGSEPATSTPPRSRKPSTSAPGKSSG